LQLRRGSSPSRSARPRSVGERRRPRAGPPESPPADCPRPRRGSSRLVLRLRQRTEPLFGRVRRVRAVLTRCGSASGVVTSGERRYVRPFRRPASSLPAGRRRGGDRGRTGSRLFLFGSFGHRDAKSRGVAGSKRSLFADIFCANCEGDCADAYQIERESKRLRLHPQEEVESQRPPGHFRLLRRKKSPGSR
jgi:hypothetical protein